MGALAKIKCLFGRHELIPIGIIHYGTRIDIISTCSNCGGTFTYSPQTGKLYPFYKTSEDILKLAGAKIEYLTGGNSHERH